MSSVQRIVRFFQKKSVRYSIPFLLLVVGGSFGLKEFTENRYRFSQKQTFSLDEAKKLGMLVKDKKSVTLESEFEKIKEIDIEHWENKRGPRPWEAVESSTVKELPK